MDLNTLIGSLNWGGGAGSGYGEYAGEAKDHKPAAPDLSGQAKREQVIGDSERGKRDDILHSTNPFLNSFLGPDATKTPFYHTLLTTGLESTGRAYEGARAATRLRARASGFGYEQPLEQGSEDQLGAAEASDMSRVPREALSEAIQPGLQASAIKTSQAGQYNGAPYENVNAGLLTGQQGAFQYAQNRRDQLLAQLSHIGSNIGTNGGQGWGSDGWGGGWGG